MAAKKKQTKKKKKNSSAEFKAKICVLFLDSKTFGSYRIIYWCSSFLYSVVFHGGPREVGLDLQEFHNFVTNNS